MKRKYFLILTLTPRLAYGVSTSGTIIYSAIIFTLLIILYTVIKRAEKEVEKELNENLPWHEFRSTKNTKKHKKTQKKSITETLQKPNKIKKSETKYYE